MAAPTCPQSGILIRTGPDYAAMGLCVMTVELVNCGTRPYPVNGRPAVRVLDATARQTVAAHLELGNTGRLGVSAWTRPPED